jgi:hypothetical protein
MKRWPYLLILAVLIAGVAASSIHNIPRIGCCGRQYGGGGLYAEFAGHNR